MSIFKLFLDNSDPFGFSAIESEKEAERPKDDDMPIRSFNSQWLMDVLSRKKVGGQIKASHTFLDEIIWGDKKIGSMRVRLSPNINIFIEQLTQDLLGQQTWILKKIVRPNIKEYAEHEEIVANDVFDIVSSLYFEGIASADENYKGLLHLAKRMAGRIRGQSETFLYQDIKEVNKDYYIIYFSLVNTGVGKLVNRRRSAQTVEALIDLNFNRERGLIHLIFSTVSNQGEGQGWSLDIPWLDAWFAPSQGKDEIISTILRTLKFY